MASVLDLGLLEGFSAIFSFILVFALMYGLLTYSKMFGENKSLHAIIAMVIAVITMFTPKATQVIKVMIPWFVMFMVAGVVIIMVYRLFGATEEGILNTLNTMGGLKWGIFVISIIIVVFSVSSVYMSGDEETGTNSTYIDASEGDIGETGESALMATLFHPKMLGLVVTLLIASFTVTLLSRNTMLK